MAALVLIAAGASGVAGQPLTPAHPSSQADAPVPVLWLERADGKPTGDADAPGEPLPLVRVIPSSDPRVPEAERLVDNEPARFARTLVARAWTRYGLPPSWPAARLPVLLEKGGNYARRGFRLQDGQGIVDHADVPYIVLEAREDSLSDTFLHESGHLLHEIATRGRRPLPWWSPFPHTTFAVTDPVTALGEGFGIHLETLYGHYGSTPQKRAFYHRLSPGFEARGTKRAEFYAPAADLLTFSQSWARYQGVRDGWAVFAGNDYENYLRSQFDPSRDRAVLKPAGAMVASEGVVASVLFWTVSGIAEARGARPGEGLSQPGLVEAEEIVLAALAAAQEKDGAAEAFRPDVLDVVAQVGAAASPERRLAVVRTVEITRGVTARPSMREAWRAFYEAAVTLDQKAVAERFGALERERVAVTDAAVADPVTLRAGLGPVLPVRAPKQLLSIPAFGDPFPLEFDLNAATAMEWRFVPGTAADLRVKILAERDRQSFASFEDFARRTGVSLGGLGIEPVARTP